MQNENTKQTLERERKKLKQSSSFKWQMQIQIQHKYITQIINKTKNKKSNVLEIRLILFVVSLLLLFFQCSRSFCAFISPQVLSLHPHKLTWYRLYQRENEIMISQIFSSSTLTRPDFLTNICIPSKRRQNYVPFIAWWDVFDFYIPFHRVFSFC